MRRITVALLILVGATIGSFNGPIAVAGGSPSGTWELVGFRRPGSSQITDRNTTAIVRFDKLNSRVVISLEFGPERCVEAIGFVKSTNSRLVMIEKGISRSAIGCTSERVPALVEMAQDLRKGVTYKCDRASMQLTASDGSRYLLAASPPAPATTAPRRSTSTTRVGQPAR